MTVKRIVANISTDALSEVRAFYETLFDLKPVMDLGWISTLATGDVMPVQLSVASEGGSGTPVPDLSIEVSDVDDTYQRACAMGLKIEYALTDEPWGVRRFYVCDPSGKLLNIVAHQSAQDPIKGPRDSHEAL